MELINLNENILLNASKQAIQDQAMTIIDAVKDGTVDPLAVMAYNHKLLTLSKEIDANIRPLALVALNGAKYASYECKFSEVKTASTYDYSGCGDLEYTKLLDQLEQAKQAVKDRETFLKSIKAPIELVDTETGETYTVTPPVNSYKTSLKIEF